MTIIPRSHRRIVTGPSPSAPPVNLLLEDDAVDAGLEERKCQAGLAFEVAQSVENVGARFGCQRCQLWSRDEAAA
ncbi:hypothetical protein GMORB2_6324 [Geosmithia morbida]|uniref:Uncharacterized protein n=1 Tax=Geosmithia morbida TaxID=1094350 RepID=A0A9P4YV14_9HYPO|nr:uncharacterized protein GMORB2_6324 [Geosmithia morbida]KAF4123623.1 hypothetical protein GMORB2_6324 [Geosmithia morbida]